MKTVVSSIVILFLSCLSFAQTIALPETVISETLNYSDLDISKNRCAYVQKLEHALLNYNHSNILDLFDDKDDIYQVTFKTPQGSITASFNKDGKIIKTQEVYKNVRLPRMVLDVVSQKFPKYAIVEDKYFVKYNSEVSGLKQEYQIKLKNDKTVIVLKTSAKGELI
ncbi:MAG: hypothetical protein ACON5F_04650 [Jejuia sp.]